MTEGHPHHPHTPHREALVLHSHAINALLPKFLRHAFYNLLFFLSLYPIYWLLQRMMGFGGEFWTIGVVIFLTLFISFLKISIDLLKIRSTSYKFYSHHVEHHYKLFKEENHSVNYTQITDLQIKKDIWDRVCGVGDIVIHTGNDEYHHGDGKALIIRDIKQPDHLKSQIESRIHLINTHQA